MEKYAEEESFFNLLPIEIILKIFETLKTVDLMSFCRAFPKFMFLYENRILLNVVDVSKQSGLITVPNFLKIINDELRVEFITVFNITNIYWATAADIRACLKKMINLEELYLLGTKMRMNQADCDSYKKLKLRKVAVPIRDRDIQKQTAQYFKHVQSLCVQITTGKLQTFQKRFQYFIKRLSCLKELWIHDINCIIPILLKELLSVCKDLRIFVFKGPYSTYSPSPYLKPIYLGGLSGLHLYLENKKDLLKIRDSIDPVSSWGQILSFITPYGLRDAKKLAYKETDINEIFFEELNFKHEDSYSNHYIRPIIREVLFSNKARFIRKLSLQTCLFKDETMDKKNESRQSRNDIEHQPWFKDFMDNLQNVNELELSICPGDEDSTIYYIPQHLKKLTNLYFEVPISIDGQFLNSTLQNCDLLHTLNICLPRSNETFCRGFYRYISQAKNLRNLRFEHYRISFETLFLALSSITAAKMECLHLICNMIDNFGLSNLRKFLNLNTNLNIMVIVSTSATEKTMKTLKDEMKSFMNSPEKIFIAEKDEFHICYPFSLPDFSKFQVLLSDTFVGTFNVFDDFRELNLPNKK